MSDPQGRFCVGDVIRQLGKPLRPAGRLDYQSSGLLVLTNDGELAARLTHARYGVLKTYVAKVSRVPSEAMLRSLRRGLRLPDGLAAAHEVRIIRASGSKAWLEISISEGRNRQVRRMLESIGMRVEKLRRTAIGPLALGKLASGDLRKLEDAEVRRLARTVGLSI
jgi:pseudouridine synthase